MTTTDTPRTDAEITKEAKIVKLTKQNYHGLAKTKAAWYETMAKTRDIYEEGENSTTDTPRIETITIKINDGWVTMRDESKEEFVRQLHFERLKIEKAEAEVERLREALDTLTLIVGLTPVAGNKEALQEAYDLARKALNPTNK